MPNIDDKRNTYPAERRTETIVKHTVCNYSNLLLAEKRCHRGVGYKNSVAKFHMLVMSRCIELHNELKNDNYRTKYGEEFEIFEPKYRIVTSTRYKDRIPQASFVVNYYYREVVPMLIVNNFACIKGRGVDVARNALKELLKRSDESWYVLKADMKNYFGSIDHDTLISEVGGYMEDEWARWYYEDVVRCNKKENGLGLGSEINQLSATSLPNELDHKLKTLKESYERYMDDFLFIGTKEECEQAFAEINEEARRLKLTVSANKSYIQPITKPIRFLGFTFLKKGKRVTLKRIKQKRNNERRKLRKMKRKGVPIERVLIHFNSVMAGMKKGGRSGYIKMWKYFNSLFKEELNEYYQKGKCTAGNADQKEQFHLTVSSRSQRGRRKNQPADSGEILDVAGAGTAS